MGGGNWQGEGGMEDVSWMNSMMRKFEGTWIDVIFQFLEMFGVRDVRDSGYLLSVFLIANLQVFSVCFQQSYLNLSIKKSRSNVPMFVSECPPLTLVLPSCVRDA